MTNEGELDLAGLLDDDDSTVSIEAPETPEITLTQEEDAQADDLVGDMFGVPSYEEDTGLDDGLSLEEAETAPETPAVSQSEVVQVNENSIKIEREKFNAFINCVKLVVDSNCTDCDIEDGLIRQFSNDKRSIIKLNLTQLLGGMNLSLSMASQKVSLLKTFELDDTVEDEGGSVAIEVDDHRIHFKDSFGHVHFSKPMKKMLDNTYVNDVTFDKKIVIDEEAKIIDVEIQNYIAKRRIKSICEVVKTDVISVKMNKSKASIDIDSPDIKTTVVKDIKLLKEMPKSKFDILLLPFAMEANSTIKFKAYKNSGDKLLCQFDLVYYKIPVTIYMITQLQK